MANFLTNVFKSLKTSSKKAKPVIKKTIPPAGLVYGYAGKLNRNSQFKPSEYDLGEIARVMDVEAYVRQAFSKYTEQVLKAGFDFVGRNNKSIDYLKKRLSDMENATKIPFTALLRGIVENVVSYSNSFIVKVRNEKLSSGYPVRQVGKAPTIPIAGYFNIDSTSIEIKRNQHGKVLSYKQVIPDVGEKEFSAHNVIHVYRDRKEGFAFGTPFVLPVLDDIRALRRLEENVELLMVKHLFPLIHYKVGTDEHPAEISEDGVSEVDKVREQIKVLPSDGSIITSERHSINPVGGGTGTIKGDIYLEYFKERVLTGLGLPTIALGSGGAGGARLAEAVERAFQDRCKDIQVTVSVFLDYLMFRELLYEGGFLWDEENKVSLKFKEIDLDSQIKNENSAVFKYEHEAITEAEMRMELGKDPLKEEERKDMHFNRIVVPRDSLKADDEEEGLVARPLGKEPREVVAKEKREAKEKTKPSNQHKQKMSPRKKTDEEIKLLKELNYFACIDAMETQWRATADDVVLSIKDYSKTFTPSTDFITPDLVLSVTQESFEKILGDFVKTSISTGTKDAVKNIQRELSPDQLCVISKRSKKAVTKKIQQQLFDLLQTLKRTRLKSSTEALPIVCVAVFDSLFFKVRILVEDVLLGSYNLSYGLAEGELKKEKKKEQ